MNRFFSSTVFARAAAAAIVAAGALASGMAQAYERWVYVHNNGNAPITGIYITHVGDDDWGFNLIGGAVFAGGSVVVEPFRHDGYCRFDILIEYANGAEVAMWRVNLCEEDQIVANEWRAVTV